MSRALPHTYLSTSLASIGQIRLCLWAQNQVPTHPNKSQPHFPNRTQNLMHMCRQMPLIPLEVRSVLRSARLGRILCFLRCLHLIQTSQYTRFRQLSRISLRHRRGVLPGQGSHHRSGKVLEQNLDHRHPVHPHGCKERFRGRRRAARPILLQQRRSCRSPRRFNRQIYLQTALRSHRPRLRWALHLR